MSRAKKARKIAARTGVVVDLARTALAIMVGSEYGAIGYIYATRAQNVPKMAPEIRRRWNEAYARSFGAQLQQYDNSLDAPVGGSKGVVLTELDFSEELDYPVQQTANDPIKVSDG
jgi:hypothetical protein